MRIQGCMPGASPRSHTHSQISFQFHELFQQDWRKIGLVPLPTHIHFLQEHQIALADLLVLWPPLSQICFIFIQFSAQIMPNKRLVPHPLVLATLSGKSWTRHWTGLTMRQFHKILAEALQRASVRFLKIFLRCSGKK